MPRFSAGRNAPTFFGWTPGLRRLICGRLLRCGCLIGVYEVDEAEFVTIVDHTTTGCTVPGHRVDLILDAGTTSIARPATEPSASVNAAALRRGMPS